MFICDYCRNHALEEKGLGFMRSKGACEMCNYYDLCWDVHGYKFKKNWQELKYSETGVSK